TRLDLGSAAQRTSHPIETLAGRSRHRLRRRRFNCIFLPHLVVIDAQRGPWRLTGAIAVLVGTAVSAATREPPRPGCYAVRRELNSRLVCVEFTPGMARIRSRTRSNSARLRQRSWSTRSQVPVVEWNCSTSG